MSRDNDILSRLGGQPPEDDFNDTTPIPIRVEADPREIGADALRRASEAVYEEDDIVREYETRYYGGEAPHKRRLSAEDLAGDERWQTLRQLEWRPRSTPVAGLGADERLWAALAHASFLLTIAVAIFTEGWASLAMVFVPLAIYFSFRDKSDFIAFHALQAFGAQILGTIGWAVFLVIGSIVFTIAITIAGLASVILIGIPFVIIFSLLFVVFVLAMLAVPVAIFLLSLIGAINTHNGRDFRFPIIAQWIDRQVSSGSITL